MIREIAEMIGEKGHDPLQEDVHEAHLRDVAHVPLRLRVKVVVRGENKELHPVIAYPFHLCR